MRSQRPLQNDGALLYFPVGRIVRSAELHSPLAEENCIIENVASLRSAKVDTPWRRYLRLSQKKIPAGAQPAGIICFTGTLPLAGGILIILPESASGQNLCWKRQAAG